MNFHGALGDVLTSSLKKRISLSMRQRLRRSFADVLGTIAGSDLSALALLYGTDKWGYHFYTQHYQRYFAPIRHKQLRILEIGVGGYSDRDLGAESLRMWKRFFHRSQVVGIDLQDKSHLSEHRMNIIQCDQTDAQKLTRISQEYGPFDIIIDDGSHLNEHVIQTFHILFPLLKSTGFYAIEDLQTAYWPSWGGIMGSSSMDFLESLVDGLNYAENPTVIEPGPYDLQIKEIAFFHNLCIIRKDKNDEPSNCSEHVRREREYLRRTQNIA